MVRLVEIPISDIGNTLNFRLRALAERAIEREVSRFKEQLGRAAEEAVQGFRELLTYKALGVVIDASLEPDSDTRTLRILIAETNEESR